VEFNGFGGSLISLALVPEKANACPFYEALECAMPNPWVIKHVLPVLRTTPISRRTMETRLAAYLRQDYEPVAVADWPEGIAHLEMLMVTGPGFRTPSPKFVFELCDLPLFHSETLSDVPHNAQYDARALRTYVLSQEGWPGALDPQHTRS
jgi:hypothetical protein